MCHQQDRAAVIFQQFPHLRLKPLPKVCIQRGKRLVQHQKLWLVHQYPAQRRPLLLAARKLVWPVLFQPLKAHHGYHIVRLFYPLSFIRLVPEAAEYILPESHIGKQGVILKKITHPALLGMKVYALSAVVEYHAVQLYVSAVRPFYARDAL